jgi:pimeloyl-ACP methyl ester carboxylesterase
MAGVENPVALMLHGFLGSPLNWRACAEAMSARHRVLVPELPIFSGLKLADRQEYVLQFLVQLLETDQAPRVVVMGNSLGGQLALHLACRKPDRIVGLVLTGSGGLYIPKSVRIFRSRLDGAWLRGYLREIFHDEATVTAAMMNELEAIFSDRARLREVVQLAKNNRNVSVRELLPQIHCPVLIIWGAEDRITPPHAAHEFHRLLPNAELHFIPRCGHAPMLERPVEFTRLAEDFMRRLSARRMAHDLMSRT